MSIEKYWRVWLYYSTRYSVSLNDHVVLNFFVGCNYRFVFKAIRNRQCQLKSFLTSTKILTTNRFTVLFKNFFQSEAAVSHNKKLVRFACEWTSRIMCKQRQSRWAFVKHKLILFKFEICLPRFIDYFHRWFFHTGGKLKDSDFSKWCQTRLGNRKWLYFKRILLNDDKVLL